MKEKNLNIGTAPGQGQENFSATEAKTDDARDTGTNNQDHTDSYTDEYDSYSPWG